MNELQNKTEKELLEELILLHRSNRKRQITTMIMVIVAAASILITSLVVVPKVVTTFSQINSLIDEADASLAEINLVVADAEKVIDDNTDNLSEIMTKINAVDFDSLNSSIKALSDILKPVADFFGTF